ncbi:MAG: methyl-accepting chemotaxis protein [Elusimicrobia bacterium]|nr:methyl-accepting chemotaxis protein [Elusimicrobiota bacterium]
MDSDSTNQGGKYQRRKVLVKRSLQLKYIALVVVSAVLITMVASGDTFYTIYRIMLREDPSLMPLVHQVQSMLLVKMVLFLGIVFLVALFLSHRFAGPIYRFEKSAQIVGTGDLTHRVSLRTGDELLELQEEFNRMVSSLQSKVQKDRALASHLTEKVNALAKNLPEDSGAASNALRKDILSLRAELEHIASGFKV